MSLTREQVKDILFARLIDNITEQIDPEDVRFVLEAIIDSAYNMEDDDLTIDDATDLVKGVLMLATAAEAEAGTDNTKAITPLRLKERLVFDNFITSQVFSIPSGENLSGLSALDIFRKYGTRPFRIASASITAFPLLEKGANNAITVAGSISANDSEFINSKQIFKNGALFAQLAAGLSFSYSDSISLTTTYLFEAMASRADGSFQKITTTRDAECVAPTFFGVSPDEFVLEAEAKSANKNLFKDAASRTFTFSANNAHAFMFEPKSHGIRARIMDQNGFNVTTGFEVIERTFTLKENTAAEGEPSNAITEAYYGYIKKQPAGNGSAFNFTFHHS